MAASDTVLLDALNRLGGRQDAPPTSRDLIAAAPRDLPLVRVHPEGPRVDAHNVEAFMARAAELEHVAFEALHRLVGEGLLPAMADPGAEPATWVTADRKGVARQAIQYALDHPEHRLQLEAFALARHVLD